MRAFYSDIKYKKKQSQIARENWIKGKYTSLIKPTEIRVCKNPKCKSFFTVKPYDPKVFCSSSCSASYNNLYRVQSEFTRKKISEKLKVSYFSSKGVQRVSRKIKICLNCKKEFKILPYLEKRRKYCSNKCAMNQIGRLTTSPRASKGQPGIRLDINPGICFYSTWEANIARVFNLVGIKWEYAPRIFNLEFHTYRPDFYLPDHNIFIEVKNFMNEYSKKRDVLFRIKYPHVDLELISKKEYKEIENEYKPLIDKWE